MHACKRLIRGCAKQAGSTGTCAASCTKATTKIMCLRLPRAEEPRSAIDQPRRVTFPQASRSTSLPPLLQLPPRGYPIRPSQRTRRTLLRTLRTRVVSVTRSASPEATMSVRPKSSRAPHLQERRTTRKTRFRPRTSGDSTEFGRRVSSRTSNPLSGEVRVRSGATPGTPKRTPAHLRRGVTDTERGQCHHASDVAPGGQCGKSEHDAVHRGTAE